MFIIISILFAIAFLGYGLYCLIKALIKKDIGNLKSGLIYLGLGIVTIAIVFYVLIGDFADSFNN